MTVAASAEASEAHAATREAWQPPPFDARNGQVDVPAAPGIADRLVAHVADIDEHENGLSCEILRLVETNIDLHLGEPGRDRKRQEKADHEHHAHDWHVLRVDTRRAPTVP
jgi:hypothetical protein